MEDNIFEHAKFGDLFHTRSGEDLVFIYKWNQFRGFVFDYAIMRNAKDEQCFYSLDGHRVIPMCDGEASKDEYDTVDEMRRCGKRYDIEDK